MAKERKMIDLGMTGYEELFTTQEMRDEAKLEKVHEIDLSELRPFEDHPFKVQNDQDGPSFSAGPMLTSR